MQDQNTTTQRSIRTLYPVNFDLNGKTVADYDPEGGYNDFTTAAELMGVLGHCLVPGNDGLDPELDEFTRSGLCHVARLARECVERIEAGHKAAVKRQEEIAGGM